MQLRAPAIVLAVRPHGETAVIARLFTQEEGLVAAYVAGGRGRHLRPVLIPGNRVVADIRSKSETQLPFGKVELVQSCGPWLAEPLPAAAIAWASALAAVVLPERAAYPALYAALSGLLDAICAARSAREWLGALVDFEALLLRDMGYGGNRPASGDVATALASFRSLEQPIARYLLPERNADVMAARAVLATRLTRMVPADSEG